MFITFEGIEGSGKTTALQSLCDFLTDKGMPYLRTREPGGSELGAKLRSLLLDARQSVSPEAELFLYLADRAQHVSQVIRPALAGQKLVLCDRYADSTIVYQGYGRGFSVQRLYRLNQMAVDGLWPDATILFDLEPRIGLARAKARNTQQGTAETEGRFEAEHMAFHQRIREGYLAWAKRHPERFRIVDAGSSPEAVFEQMLAILSPIVS